MTKATDRSLYLLPVSVFGSALFGLALSVTIPYFLIPAEYALFSLSLAIVQLVSSVGFEWLRICVIRHSTSTSVDPVPINDTLRALYFWAVLALCAIGLSLGAIAETLDLSCMPAFICIAAALQGAFDGRSAWSRARFQNMQLALSMVGRPALSLIIVLSVSSLTRHAEGAIAGLALSYLPALLLFRDSPSTWAEKRRLDLNVARKLALFGGSAAVSTNVSLALPAALRSIILASLGEAAGGALLALDIGQRVFATIGTAFNLLHLQVLIQSIDNAPLVEALAKARRSITLETILYTFLVTGLSAAAHPLGEIIAPKRFEMHFITFLPGMAMLMAALCLRQYAIEPLLIAFKKVKFLASGPIITLILFSLTYYVVRNANYAPLMFVPMLFLSAAAGFIAPIALLGASYRRSIPYIALLLYPTAGALALRGIPNCNELGPIPALLLQGGLAGVIYIVIASLIFRLSTLLEKHKTSSQI